jgi:hypothetical protein
MAGDDLPARQHEALKWLQDHKLHQVLIRAPFADEQGHEITDPAFEPELLSDPDAARHQRMQEFEADRLAGIERDKQRGAQHRAAQRVIPLPW